MAPKSRRTCGIVLASATLVLGIASPAQAALQWKGLDWEVTNGGMAGVAKGSAANVSIDASGYLHLNIKKNGDTWTASEVFTTQKLGFGTYQWQIEGPVDTFDKQIVLGLFPYGPAANIGVSGTNEIDIEWARWGYADGTNVGFTNYPNSGSVVGNKSYKATLGGSKSSTARFTWTSEYIESSVYEGHRALTSEQGLLAKWKYEPQNPSTNIPQQAMPLGINLWCFGTPPSDGKNQEIVIRDFQFIKEGDPLPGEGGAGGGGSGGAPSGGAGAGAVAGSDSGEKPLGGTGSGGGAGGANGGAAGANDPAGGSPSAGASTGGTGGTGGTGSPTPGGASSTAGSTAAGGSSSTGGTSSMAGSGGVQDPSGDDGSCSCSVPGREPSRGSWLIGALLLGASALFRRRGGRGAGSVGAPRASA